jgi:hypothetical protein
VARLVMERCDKDVSVLGKMRHGVAVVASAVHCRWEPIEVTASSSSCGPWWLPKAERLCSPALGGSGTDERRRWGCWPWGGVAPGHGRRLDVVATVVGYYDEDGKAHRGRGRASVTRSST